MKNWKIKASMYLNPVTLRLIYILLAILAMALAGGAPDQYGGGGGG